MKNNRIFGDIGSKSKYSSKTGYRYDGLYYVTDYWHEVFKSINVMSKKTIVLIFIFLITIECAFSQTITTNPLILEREDGSLITYYLETRNDEKRSKELFILFQGSDYNSVRNIPNIDKIKAVLPNADILTIEKYGITDALPYSNNNRDSLPKEYLDFDNPTQRVSDANLVVTSLMKNFNYEKIFVFGGSEGAIVAYLLTSKYSYVHATITIGGGGRYFIDDIIQTIMCSEELSEQEKMENIEGIKQFSQYILSQDTLDFNMSEHGFLWWKTMFSLDSQEVINNISSPLLILQGGKDDSASPEKATEMVQALRQSGKNNIDYLFYPEYDHALNFSFDDKSADAVLFDIRRWLFKIAN